MSLGVATVLFGALCCWIGYALFSAYSGLTGARDRVVAAKSALLSGDESVARSEILLALQDAADARDAVTSAPLSWIGDVPVLGSPVATVAGMSDVVYRLLDEVLSPAVNSSGMSMFATYGGGDRHLDLAALTDSVPALKQSSDAAEAVSLAAKDIPRASYVARVNDARDDLIAQTDELTVLVGNVYKASQILPSMLGADGPRNFLMVFQTNAESRGTGGLLGGTAVLHVENGAITVEKPGSNSELPGRVEPIDLGPDFEAMYGGVLASTTNWQNANFSPHFPYAAQIWRSIWAQQTGLTVDGVIATDPVALSYLLGSAGPVTLTDGEVIDASNVVRITENEAYFRYGEDNRARKEYLQEISRRVIEKVNGAQQSIKSMLPALGKAIGEGRIAVWSAHPAEQHILAELPVGHVVPEDDAPYANVVVNNGAGGKLDYFLARDISYTAGDCEGQTRDSTVTTTLTNNAPLRADYPSWVEGRLNPDTTYPGPPGTNRTVVSLFATHGATLKHAFINGVELPFVIRNNELGHPVFTAAVVTQPGQSATVTFELSEPTVPGAVRVPIQPLVLPATVHIDVPNCQ